MHFELLKPEPRNRHNFIWFGQVNDNNANRPSECFLRQSTFRRWQTGCCAFFRAHSRSEHNCDPPPSSQRCTVLYSPFFMSLRADLYSRAAVGLGGFEDSGFVNLSISVDLPLPLPADWSFKRCGQVPPQKIAVASFATLTPGAFFSCWMMLQMSAARCAPSMLDCAAVCSRCSPI
eukprot:TRINITY_DN4132_c0_g1_i3.p1 TRINITY_DN4132_c0_g1~~TRINITY_DN4132_c0_g1_i3.p1  ORF type:complete len:176 (+),score=19.87 TRINITY_DN4132_c0_g1_i3:605-1132(+)